MDALGLDDGYRFYPTDQEIILFLERKRLDPSFSVHTILEANITDYEPNQLFELPAIRFDEKWCNFFSPSKYVNGNGDRVRSTGTGYWKSTGKIREIKAKRSNRVIGHKRILVFHERHGSKEIGTDCVMHEYTNEHDPLFQGDFVLCRIKKKQDKKHRLSTKNKDEQVQKPRVEAKKRCLSTKNKDKQVKKPRVEAKKSRANGRVKKSCADGQVKKSRADSRVKTQTKKSCVEFINDERQLSHNVTYDYGNHVAENISPESQCDSISNSRNHVAENVFLRSQLISNCDSISNSRNHVAENVSLQSQLISTCDSISNRNHVAETPEYPSQVDTLNGSSGLDQTSFYTPLSPIQPVPGSSYSGVSANDYDVSRAPLGIEWDDIFMVQEWPVPDEYPREEAEHSTPLDFSLSKSVEGSGGHSTPLDFSSSESAEGSGGNSCDMETDDFNEWVSKLFDNNTSEACLEVLEY